VERVDAEVGFVMLVLCIQYQTRWMMTKGRKSKKSVTTKRSSGGKSVSAGREKRRRDRLLSQLPDLEKVLRGSLVTRYRRCGRRNCHCAREGDPGHGPAYYLMVTLAPGETVQIYVPKEQKQEVEAWVDNFRRVRETLEKISTVNRELLKQGKLFEGG